MKKLLQLRECELLDVEFERGRLLLRVNGDPAAMAAVEAYSDAVLHFQSYTLPLEFVRRGGRSEGTWCAGTFWKIFHKSWGSCKDDAGYDKKAWMYVQSAIDHYLRSSSPL